MNLPSFAYRTRASKASRSRSHALCASSSMTLMGASASRRRTRAAVGPFTRLLERRRTLLEQFPLAPVLAELRRPLELGDRLLPSAELGQEVGARRGQVRVGAER